MINENNYFIRLPGLKYDKEGLIQLAESLKNDWKKFIIPNTNIFIDYQELRNDNLINNPLIINIIENLNSAFPVDNGRLAFIKFDPYFHLEPHIDPTRTAALMFPLTTTPAPIYWEENGVEVVSHVYDCPTIINAKKIHGVHNDVNTRLCFVISIKIDWDEILEIFKSTNILTAS